MGVKYFIFDEKNTPYEWDFIKFDDEISFHHHQI